MRTRCSTMDGVKAISYPSPAVASGKGTCGRTGSRIPSMRLQHGAPCLRRSPGWMDGMLVRRRKSEAASLGSGSECRSCNIANVADDRLCNGNGRGTTVEVSRTCRWHAPESWYWRRQWGNPFSSLRKVSVAVENGFPALASPFRRRGLPCELRCQRSSNGKWTFGPLKHEEGSSDMGGRLQSCLVFIMTSFCLAVPWTSNISSALAEVFNESDSEPKYISVTSNFQLDAATSRLRMKIDAQEFPYSLIDRRNVETDGASPATAGVNYSVAAASKTCQESYGFLPCSDSLGGNVALMVAYGYCLLLAAQLISNGSELLLEVMNAGLIGGLLLPILGALPDALLILVSGVGGSAQEAQQEVMVGVGVLAGSIVMLLTIGWAGSLFAGRCDLSGPGGTAEDRTLTRPLDWTGTGVTTDEQTREGAWVMALSALPFVLVQVPLLDGHPSEGPEAAVIGAVVCAIGFVAYSVYQVAYPWLQQKRIGEARLTFLKSRALQKVAAFSGYRRDRDGSQRHFFGSSSASLKEVFSSFDNNNDGMIQRDELAGLLVGLGLEEEGAIPDSAQVKLWLQDFDQNSDGRLTEHEFTTGIAKWADKVSKEKWSKTLQRLSGSSQASNTSNFWAGQSDEAKKVLDLLESEAGGEDEEVEEESEAEESLDAGAVKRKAAVFLAGGAALAATFADPLVDAIGGFSTASGIPPFFVAFVVTPFASNASELVSSLLFAKGRKKKNISLTFSQLYGGVTMNNTLCLGIFLTLVYIRGLTWDFSSEVTVILTSVLILGALGGSRNTFPLWLALPVLAIYPFCISVVALLDNFLGWQ